MDVIGGIIGGSKGTVVGVGIGEAIDKLLGGGGSSGGSNGGSKGGSSGKSSGSKSSSGGSSSRGSRDEDAAKRQAEETRRKAEAQIAEMLKGNENAKDLMNLIKAEKLSCDEAMQAGKSSEAEMYAEGAQILLQKLKEQGTKEKSKTITDNFLNIGDKGDAVKELQSYLRGAGIIHVTVGGVTKELKEDGAFGKITQEAVKTYQRIKGLKEDGIAGPQTLKSLIGSNYNKYAEILDKMQSGKGQ